VRVEKLLAILVNSDTVGLVWTTEIYLGSPTEDYQRTYGNRMVERELLVPKDPVDIVLEKLGTGHSN